jgi:DNA modification methylase
MTNITFKCGDNAELIKDIPSNSVQMVYFNPPYAITKKEWDKDLDWDTLFPQMWRVLKPNGVIVIHCSIPFTWRLIKQKWSKDLKYQYYWDKVCPTNFLNSTFSPLRQIEDILVYYKKKPIFNYDKNPNYVNEATDEVYYNTGYYGNKSKCVKDGEKLPLKKMVKKGEGNKGCPRDIIRSTRTGSDFTRPDDIMRFFIKTYTNEGDTVLDPTCGDGRCARICNEEGRGWIGFDIRDLGQGAFVDGLKKN